MSRHVGVSGDLLRTMTEIHGAEGVEWIGRLPAILADCGRRWSLTVGPPFPGLTYAYVAPAVRTDGTASILKLCFPRDQGFRTEGEALKLFDGHGIARLLEIDADRGVMLLERLEPGTPLDRVGDDERATSIAATVMRRLWRPVPDGHPFPSVAGWASGLQRSLRDRFDGGTGPLPAVLVEEAERLFAELIASMAEPVLLHGDLHHGNILAAGRETWLAIDPKGVIGEPAYETGALLRNPRRTLLEQPRPGRILARRIDQLSEELGFDRARLRGWGLAQAVLSAVWSLEDRDDRGRQYGVACAQLLATIKV